MRFKAVSIALALALCAIAPLRLAAQTITSGDITGTVTDPSGAVKPNATVTATNQQTGEARSATSNASGVYRIPFLRPGPYTVSVNAAGFGPANRNASVAVGQSANVNLALALT